MDELIKCNVTFGTVELVNCYKPAEEGGVWFGGYSRHYDTGGNLVVVTEPVYHFRVYLDAPLKSTLWQRLTAWMR